MTSICSNRPDLEPNSFSAGFRLAHSESDKIAKSMGTWEPSGLGSTPTGSWVRCGLVRIGAQEYVSPPTPHRIDTAVIVSVSKSDSENTALRDLNSPISDLSGPPNSLQALHGLIPGISRLPRVLSTINETVSPVPSRRICQIKPPTTKRHMRTEGWPFFDTNSVSMEPARVSPSKATAIEKNFARPAVRPRYEAI